MCKAWTTMRFWFSKRHGRTRWPRSGISFSLFMIGCLLSSTCRQVSWCPSQLTCSRRKGRRRTIFRVIKERLESSPSPSTSSSTSWPLPGSPSRQSPITSSGEWLLVWFSCTSQQFSSGACREFASFWRARSWTSPLLKPTVDCSISTWWRSLGSGWCLAYFSLWQGRVKIRRMTSSSARMTAECSSPSTSSTGCSGWLS